MGSLFNEKINEGSWGEFGEGGFDVEEDSDDKGGVEDGRGERGGMGGWESVGKEDGWRGRRGGRGGGVKIWMMKGIGMIK